MKILTIIFLLLAAVSVSKAQEDKLVGTWSIIYWEKTGDGTSDIRDEAKLKEDGTKWDITLDDMEEVSQVDNLNSGEEVTHTGEWFATDKKLTIEFMIEGNKVPIVYDYVLDGDVLTLTGKNLQSTVTLTVKFRKQ